MLFGDESTVLIEGSEDDYGWSDFIRERSEGGVMRTFRGRRRFITNRCNRRSYAARACVPRKRREPKRDTETKAAYSRQYAVPVANRKGGSEHSKKCHIPRG